MSTQCPIDDLDLIQLEDGELTENRAREVNQHTASCAACGARADRFAALVARLRSPSDPEADADFLRAVERRIVAQPRTERNRRRRSVMAWSLTVAAAAAAVSLFVGFRQQSDPSSPSLVARGQRADWRDLVTVSLRIARANQSSGSARATLSPGVHLGVRDGVVVEARNGNRDRAVYLMVFGVDARGDVHWLHPAWIDPKQNPRSVELPPGGTLGQTPEAVAPEHPAPGRFRLNTLVTRVPLDVRQVEALLASGRSLSRDGRLDTVELDVSP